MARDTLVDFFGDLSCARGDFLVYDDGFRSHTYTYDQVSRAARRFAARLHAHQLRQGHAVIVWSENRPEWIVAFWACLLRGLVVVPIDYRASPDFLARVARIVDARLVLVGDEVAPIADSVAPPVWRLHDLAWHETPSDVPEPPAVAATRDDVVEIIFTSGATSEPKGVLITHRNVLANIVPVEREILKYSKVV